MRLYVWHGGLIYVKKVTEKVSKNVLKTCRNVPEVTLKCSLRNLGFANARRRVIMNTAVDQQLHSAGWSSLVARRAHNPKVVGSNPAPATNFSQVRWLIRLTCLLCIRWVLRGRCRCGADGLILHEIPRLHPSANPVRTGLQ